MSFDPPTPSTAMASLAEARAAATRGHARSRWIVLFQALLGAALGSLTALLGLVGTSPARVGVITVCVLSFIGGVTVWGLRQRVVPSALARRYTPYLMATIVLYVLVLIVGRRVFADDPAWWMAAGVGVAAPLLLGAWRAGRR